MNKPLFFASLLCLCQLALLPADAQNSFYGHDRTWNNMKTVGNQAVSSDYLVPSGTDAVQGRSSAPFGTYRNRTAGTTPMDPRMVQAQRRLQALQQQQARQNAMYQQQQMRQQQMYVQPQSGSYYTPGQNTQAQTPYYTNGSGAATYSYATPAPQQTYRPAQTRTTNGK